MKKILLSIIACSIFVSPILAQNAKPSRKELLKIWKTMPVEGQNKLLDYSKQVSMEYNNVAKTAEAAPAKVTENTVAARVTPATPSTQPPARNTQVTAPVPTQKVQMTETNSLPKQQPQNQVVEPKRPAVTVSPATPNTVVDKNVVSTLPPAKVEAKPVAKPTPINNAVTPDAKAETRPDYQIKAESMAKTTIKWDSEKFEFGKIKQGEVTTHAFHFKNTGTNPLLLTYVRPSCGCTATNWTKEVVPPGGEGMVEINFNSAGKQGQQHKVVTVFSNTEPIMQNLQFTGDVFLPDAATPAHDSHEGHNH